jgi:gentisate 1,2-dioxygenase
VTIQWQARKLIFFHRKNATRNECVYHGSDISNSPKQMTTIVKFLTGLLLVAISSIVLLHTGLARKAFFELFAYVKGVDVLGPTIARELPTDSPYQVWLAQAKTEIPVLEGMMIDDVTHVSLRPWPQLGAGVTGLYLRFADYQITDGRIIEIPAHGNTISQRYLYEQNIYFLTGSGYTLLQQEDEQEQRVEWQQGDLFSVPLNVPHRHVNTGPEQARMLIVSSFPLMLNVLGSEEFIADNPFAFTDRYDGAEDYFDRADPLDDLAVSTNFVKDVPHTETRPYGHYGRGNQTMRWLMAGNSMLSLHISEMLPEHYNKAHRHSSDAFILLLSGTGFSLTWPEAAFQDHVRVDWKAGTLFTPPTYWYHQHLNTGSTPARYLAINVPVFVRNIGLRFSDQLEVDIEEVRNEWNKALEKNSRDQQ